MLAKGLVKAAVANFNQLAKVLEIAGMVLLGGQRVQDRSDTLFEDEIGKSFVRGRLLLQETFQAILGLFLDVALVSLEELELHADDLCFDLHGVEIKPGRKVHRRLHLFRFFLGRWLALAA